MRAVALPCAFGAVLCTISFCFVESCTYSVGELRVPDAPIDAPIGPCGDVKVDPKNCGACGRDCLGGTCADGTCVPVSLASDTNDPRALVVDDAAVYWASGARVFACPGKSCQNAPLVIAVETAPVIAIATNKLHLLWATTTSIHRYVKDTGEIARVDNGAATAVTALVATDAHFLFTQGSAAGGVDRCELAGCPANDAEHLATGFDRPMALAQSPIGFAFVGGSADGGARGVVFCRGACADEDGGAGQILARVLPDRASVVRLDARNAYFTSSIEANGGVARAAVSEPHTPTSLAEGDLAPNTIAIDESDVYFVSNDRIVRSVPKTGGPTRVATITAAVPNAIAVDEKRIWLAVPGSAGGIFWVAK